MADDILLKYEYAGGLLFEAQAVHWPAGLPQRPMTFLSALQRGQIFVLPTDCHIAVEVGEPLTLWCMTRGADGLYSGVRYFFWSAGRPPTVGPVTVDASQLPPAVWIPSMLIERVPIIRPDRVWIGNFPKAVWHRWRMRRH